MSLSRNQYVAICETCANRKFDPKVGLLCGLTNQYAAFEVSCPDMVQDELAVKRIDRMKKHNEEALNRSVSSNVFTNFSSAGFWGGLGMILLGVAWLIAGLAVNRIFFYPVFLVIGGIYVIFKAGVKKAQDLNRPDRSAILDDDLE